VSEVVLKIDGMHCDKCAARLESLFGKEPGVRKATVSFADNIARLTFNAQAVKEARLIEVVAIAGFDALVQSS